MFKDLWRTYAALAQTGLLSPGPWPVLFQFLGCYLRFGGSLYTLAAWAALRFPERVALVEAGQRVSFRELISRADQLANQLGPDSKITGLLGRNRIAYVETLLACSRLGREVVLLNTSFSAEQLGSLCRARALQTLICDPEFQPRVEATLAVLAAGAGQNISLPQILYTDHLAQAPSAPRLARRFNPRTSRITLLTSGTTGPAKLVRRKLGLGETLGVLQGLLGALQPKTGEATLLTIPLLHGHGLATLALSLAMGAPLYLFPKAQAEDFLQCIQEQGIKVVVLVPTILYRLLGALSAEANLPAGKLASLRSIVCGSAPLDPSLATRCLKHFGPILYNLYGTSETGILSLATPDDLRQAPASVGRVLPGVRLRVMRSNQTEAATGEAGHIWVGSLNTGDVGYLDPAGRLFLLGRADDMLICGGENVYPQTIEASLTDALEYVEECAAIGFPDPEFGQAIHLFVVVKDEAVSPETIAQDLKAIFPRALRPKQITLVEALPRNLAGKIQRQELVQMAGWSAQTNRA